MSPELNPWSGGQCLSSSPGLRLCSTQPLASENLGPSFGPGPALSSLAGVLASVCLWPSLQPRWEGVAVFDDGRRGPAVTQGIAMDTQERPLCTRTILPLAGPLGPAGHGTTDWVPNWERSTSRLYIVTLLIWLVCRVHYAKCWAGWSPSWNQDCQEKYQ